MVLKPRRPDPPGPGPWKRTLIVAVYMLVFWLLLPALLYRLGTQMDATLRLRMHPTPLARGLGWLAMAGGMGLLAWSMLELWRRGGGLPVSALPPPRLVCSGPYRWVRHPIYLGFNVALFGAGLVVSSPALAWIVAPGFFPLWAGYALVEEHFLLRRLGGAYRRYQEIVGLLPRMRFYVLGRLAVALNLLPIRMEGRENLVKGGPAVLVGNHTCYLDCFYLGYASRRNSVYLVTSEVFRSPRLAWLMRRFRTIAVRRYRTDPIACREMLRCLSDGEVVAVFPEGERSPLGQLQPPFRRSAEILARLPCPVVPVGITGAYDVGPRWAGVLRRRPVTVRIGKPIVWSGGSPADDLAAALRALLPADSQPVHLQDLPLERLARVLWRCPACLDEESWRPEALRCARCGAAWEPTACGRFAAGGKLATLAELADPVWAAPETRPLRVRAEARREASVFGRIQPLFPLGEGILEVGPHGLRFGDLALPVADIRSVTTEHAGILQLATARDMWQFRFAEGSVFRAHQALEVWRSEARKPAARLRRSGP